MADFGACPCGMRGNISNEAAGIFKPSWRSWDITSKDNGKTHRSNWWWDSETRRMDGICTETKQTFRN